MGVAPKRMAAVMHGGGASSTTVVVMMLILALVLSIMTSMAGSSRTLYQASVDGWLPKYLSHVNSHGAPTRAMWTDLGFNLILLLMSGLRVRPRGIQRRLHHLQLPEPECGLDSSARPAGLGPPLPAPTRCSRIGAVLAFVNVALMGMGADV